MGTKLDDKELEKLAAAEILKEAKRGREREKTLGAYGWKKPVNKPNKLFIGRTVASALRQTRYQDRQRCSKRSSDTRITGTPKDRKSSSKSSKEHSARIEMNEKSIRKRKKSRGDGKSDDNVKRKEEISQTRRKVKDDLHYQSGKQETCDE